MWFLMKAAHLGAGPQSIDTIVKEHFGDGKGVIYVVKTQGGRKMFATGSGGEDNTAVGSTTAWTIDTGNGNRMPSYDHDRLTVENVILINASRKTFINQVGVDERRNTWVFK